MPLTDAEQQRRHDKPPTEEAPRGAHGGAKPDPSPDPRSRAAKLDRKRRLDAASAAARLEADWFAGAERDAQAERAMNEID